VIDSIFVSENEMKKWFLSVFFGVLISVVAMSCTADIGEIEQDAVVIDVRTLQEWESGHVETAIFLPVSKLSESIESVVPDKSQQVILYCKSGVRARRMLNLMEDLGYENVINAKSVKGASELLNVGIVK